MKSIHIRFPAYFILLLVIATGCQNKTTTDGITTDGTTADAATDPALAKCWANAFEEESDDGSMIFRPCATHTFPAARYRNTFTLQENGTAEYSVMASNDAHTTGKGKWEYDVNTKKLRITGGNDEVIHLYRVEEIMDDVLRVRE